PLFDFPVYFKFFIGLFALVNPVGIIPVFISMTSYQTATARNKIAMAGGRSARRYIAINRGNVDSPPRSCAAACAFSKNRKSAYAL
ncbi:hypothetical protein MJI12_26730, partial [Salmonella enterica subsp. enterica serovar Kentucky]|nr:hypothetical protein [Salmonella enterica subsp. enterica serovar Kentucky]